MSDARAVAKSPDTNRWSQTLTLVLFVGVVVYAGFAVGLAIDPDLTDARADWITTTAALKGADPWTDVPTLAGEFNTTYLPVASSELGDFERVHPRTPGALLLMLPLSLFPAGSAQIVMVVVASIAGLFAAFVLSRWFDRSVRTAFWVVSTLLVGSAAYLSTLEFGTQSTLLLLMIVLTWHLTRSRDSVWAGIPLGIAMALRIFPGLLLIPLWVFGKRKASGSSVATFLVLNVVGLVVLDLNLSNGLTALQTASRGWGAFTGNGSLVMPLARLGIDIQVAATAVVALAIAATLYVSVNNRVYFSVLSFAVVVALLGSPLSWAHYDVLAFPVVAYLVISVLESDKRDSVLSVLLGLWLVLQLIAAGPASALRTDAFNWSGSLAIAGRLVLMAAVLRLLRTEARAERHLLSNPEPKTTAPISGSLNP